jgi:hypothetical protein
MVTDLAPDSLKRLLAQISPCRPELGRALGHVISGVGVGGTEELVAIAFSYTPPLVDSAAFSASLEVASASSAGELARVNSLIALTYYLDREMSLSYDGIASHVRGATACAAGADSDPSKTDIAGDYTPLPMNAATQSRAVAVAIQQETGASPAVQSASYCLLEAWRRSTGRPSNAHWLFTPASIAVDYVCGNRFKLRNLHPGPINVEWSVGNLPKRIAHIPAATSQGSGERLIDTGIVGDLLVFLDGDVIISRQNLGVSCP